MQKVPNVYFYKNTIAAVFYMGKNLAPTENYKSYTISSASMRWKKTFANKTHLHC